jgi:hypothetical protein
MLIALCVGLAGYCGALLVIKFCDGLKRDLCALGRGLVWLAPRVGPAAQATGRYFKGMWADFVEADNARVAANRARRAARAAEPRRHATRGGVGSGWRRGPHN